MATAEVIQELPAKAPATQLEITVNRKELLAELAAVVGVVERTTTIPILGNLLIDVSAEVAALGGSVKIAATNLSQSLTTYIPAKIKSPGTATIPARKLYDYVRLLSSKEESVTIRQEENHWIHLKCGRSKTRMVGMAPASFPKLPQLHELKEDIPAYVLRTFISKALVTVSDVESRYVMTAALLEVTGERYQMVSTDGSRLTRISKAHDRADYAPALRWLIPRAALAELLSILKSSETTTVEIGEDDSTLYFRLGVRTLTTQKIAGNFPQYERAMPNHPRPGLLLDVETVWQSLERCLLFSAKDTRCVAFRLSKDSLSITSAAAGVGETEEQLDIHGGPETALAIGYNGDFLKDLLSGQVDGTVEFRFKDNNSAALFTHRTDDGTTLEAVIMPMRLGGK